MVDGRKSNLKHTHAPTGSRQPLSRVEELIAFAVTSTKNRQVALSRSKSLQSVGNAVTKGATGQQGDVRAPETGKRTRTAASVSKHGTSRGSRVSTGQRLSCDRVEVTPMASLKAKTCPPCIFPGEPAEMGLARLAKYDHISGIGIAMPPKRQALPSEAQAKYLDYKAEGFRDRVILGTQHCHPKNFQSEYEEMKACQSHIMRLH